MSSAYYHNPAFGGVITKLILIFFHSVFAHITQCVFSFGTDDHLHRRLWEGSLFRDPSNAKT